MSAAPQGSAAEVSSPRVEPRRHGELRLAFFRAVERSCVLLGGRRLYRARHLARGRFALREEWVRVEQLPAALEGFLVAQLSDFHGGPFLGRGDLAAVVEAVNEREPDLCALTGDYITHRWHDALPLAEDLGRLCARHGTFAVFGNHDYRKREERLIAQAYGGVGIRFLCNESARIAVGDATLAVVGLEDLEEARQVDLDAARRGLRPGDVELLLCHNPLAAAQLARAGCAAILAGHTHGTQIDLPFLRELGPKHPGARVELGPTTLIVNRGLGVVGLPLRVGAPAEVVLLRLSSAEGAARP